MTCRGDDNQGKGAQKQDGGFNAAAGGSAITLRSPVANRELTASLRAGASPAATAAVAGPHPRFGHAPQRSVAAARTADTHAGVPRAFEKPNSTKHQGGAGCRLSLHCHLSVPLGVHGHPHPLGLSGQRLAEAGDGRDLRPRGGGSWCWSCALAAAAATRMRAHEEARRAPTAPARPAGQRGSPGRTLAPRWRPAVRYIV